MNWKASIFIAAMAFSVACSSGNQEDDHDHGTDTHMHEGEEQGHENGDHVHEQEEFTVGEDTTATDHGHSHENGEDHEH